MGKFAPTGQSVEEIFVNLKSKAKQNDAWKLLVLHEKISGEQPTVWYPGIIGFGKYHYRYPTGTQGYSPNLAFAVRSAKLCFYIDQNLPNRSNLLSRLGKHATGVGCVYVNKLDDIDLNVLEEILQASLIFLKEKENK